ncbi:MAG TPA: allantoate amidohydrolase [Streptosporangiaceae bacterium]|nr:allantoate amidohydrolase [Streptosporangiaceae bacterium]
MAFADLWAQLEPVGKDAGTGGYRRYSWTPADLACREWFTATAADLGLRPECDRNGNLWAWWAPPGVTGPAIATGSHLDSVPDGGAFDGPLGIVSAFAAIDLLREQGFAPARPVVVAAFTEEEGARFGVACLGSRLAAGVITPAAARSLRDSGGASLAEAMTAAGLDPAALGPDEDRLAGLACYVELHIEQGSALDGLGAPVGVGESIWPHGRWRLELTGRADHAGTTRIADRRDPMLPYAAAVLAARRSAVAHGALATFGKVVAEPGGTNAICSAVRAWLDARAPDEDTLATLTGEVSAAAQAAAAEQGVGCDMRRESFSPVVTFDAGLRDRLAAVLDSAGAPVRAAGPVPVLPTGAGHDAGVLAARLPTAMLFVRNPSGVSHSPAEHAEPADCAAGVTALAAVLRALAGS